MPLASRRPLQFFASVLSTSVSSLLVRAYSCATRFLSNTHKQKRETTGILVRFPARCFRPFLPENLQLIFISFVSYSHTLHVLIVACTFTAALAAHSNSLHCHCNSSFNFRTSTKLALDPAPLSKTKGIRTRSCNGQKQQEKEKEPRDRISAPLRPGADWPSRRRRGHGSFPCSIDGAGQSEDDSTLADPLLGQAELMVSGAAAAPPHVCSRGRNARRRTRRWNRTQSHSLAAPERMDRTSSSINSCSLGRPCRRSSPSFPLGLRPGRLSVAGWPARLCEHGREPRAAAPAVFAPARKQLFAVRLSLPQPRR